MPKTDHTHKKLEVIQCGSCELWICYLPIKVFKTEKAAENYKKNYNEKKDYLFATVLKH